LKTTALNRQPTHATLNTTWRQYQGPDSTHLRLSSSQ